MQQGMAGPGPAHHTCIDRPTCKASPQLHNWLGVLKEKFQRLLVELPDWSMPKVVCIADVMKSIAETHLTCSKHGVLHDCSFLKLCNKQNPSGAHLRRLSCAMCNEHMQVVYLTLI